jgi:F-type H+-transporting ATPase subunit b
VQTSASVSLQHRPCETWRNQALALSLVLMVAASVVPVRTQGGEPRRDPGPSQPAPHAAVSEHAVAAGHTGEEEHGGGFVALAGKLFNFAVLAGCLVYFLREPFRQYLANRSTAIRSDLVAAASMKEDAARQIAEIDAKLKQLPSQLDALRARGHDEMAAERARIEQAAATERDRLLEQTRREINLQVRSARRDLVTHAADLAVQVARERIRHRISDEDQRRLVDRYLEQVRPHG